MRIPDPIELLNSRIESYMDDYIDENTCMECGKKVDYELLCPSPIGDGPALCVECLGFDPFESKELK
jgi:hypothetical protein